MSRTAPVLTAILLLAVTIAPCPGQVRPELQPDAVLSTIRDLIPVMNRTLEVRVYEPIPIRVVKARELEKALTREIKTRLQVVWHEDVSGSEPPRLTESTEAPTSRTHTVAAQVAAKLAPRYLVRCVFEKKNAVLYVVPENLDSLLTSDRSPLGRIRALLRFELTRELTRLADEETRSLRNPPIPSDTTSHALAARVAFLEGRAIWAASRLVPGLDRALAPIQVTAANLRDESQVDQLLLYAYAGTGCERGGIWARQLAQGSGMSAMKAMVLEAPTAFSAFPAAAGDPSERVARPGPLDGVVSMIRMLCAGDAWQVSATKPTVDEIGQRFERGKSSHQTRTLLAGMCRIRESTAQQPGGGQIHLSAVALKNPSAAYAWMRAEEQRLAKSLRAMATDDCRITSQRKQSRDLSGYPVLLMTQVVVETEETTMKILRTFAVRGCYFVEVSALNAPLDWDRVRAFLEKARPLLASGPRYPG